MHHLFTPNSFMSCSILHCNFSVGNAYIPRIMAAQKASSFQTANVTLIAVAHFIHDVYSSFLAPILPLLIDKLGMSYFTVGLISVVQRIPSLFNPFVGLLADNMSVRYFLIIAPALTTVSMSLLGLAPNVVLLTILLFVMGISSTLFHVPGPVFIKSLAGDKIGRGMSFYMLGGEFARTVAPMVILGAVSLWGLEGSYRLMVFGVLASIVLYFRFHNIPVNVNERSAVAEQRGVPHELWRFFFMLLMFTFFRSIMKSAFTMFLPTYMKATGASLWMGGASLSILQFSGAIGTLFAGPISDRFGRRSSLFVIAFMSPVLMILFVHSAGWLSIFILIILGLFMFANGPVILAYVQEIGRERPAFSNGVYMTISFFISALAAMLVGLLSDFFGLKSSFMVAGLLAFGGLPIVFFLPKASPSLHN